jgi:flagellar biosynthesis component FlhA
MALVSRWQRQTRLLASNPARSLVPKLLSQAPVQNLRPNLLRQCASILDAVGILEALAEDAPITKAIFLLMEYVRQAFRSRVLRRLLEPSSDLSKYLLHPLQLVRDMVAA